MDHLVEEFLIFTGGFDRSTAIEFLRGTDNNLERAVNEYYENPDPSRFAKKEVKWDDSHFSGDREGARSQIEEVPPFQLDDNPRGRSQLQSLTAPSRPPSRTASRASQRTLRGSDVEMNENVSGGTDLDDDLQKAIRMSMMDAQESGTIDSAGHEIVPDVDVTERGRQRDEPAFLKPLSTRDFLPSLITILHSIPRCRHLLLAKKDLLLNYGQNPHWWSGSESIEVSRVMDLDHSYGRESMDILDAVHETQRLMAFLDKTTRAYGSASVLARLPAMKELYSSDDSYSGFLKLCEKASKVTQINKEQPSLFRSSTAATSKAQSDSVNMLKLGLNDILTRANSTLYDVLDRFLDLGATPGVWLETIAPVLVIQLPSKPIIYSGGTGSTHIDIPGTLYADRYHVENKETILNMYTELAEGRKVVDGIEAKLAQIEMFKSSASDNAVSAAALLDTTKAYFEIRKQEEEASVDPTNESGISTTQILEKLQTIYEHLNARVKVLQQERDQAQASLRALSQVLTLPTDTEGLQPKMRYRLVGVATVATHHAETYIPSSIPSTQVEAGPKEWWRFTYDTGGRGTSALMMREALTEATVLNAAGKLEETTLLVFANDAMLDTTGIDGELPDALKDFVNHDNAAFNVELQEYQLRATAQLNIPNSPPPEYEPPPGPPPGDRMMNYDGHVDEKETVDPANLTLTGAGVENDAVVKEQKGEDNKADTVQEMEEDVEMTDISS